MPISSPKKSPAFLLATLMLFYLSVIHAAQGQPTLLRDVNTGAQYNNGSLPFTLTACNDLLFFSAITPDFGQELWVSDGTALGTEMVKDIAPLAIGAQVSGLTAVNNTLYFSASDQVHGNELWKTDGTEAGTVLIDIVPGSSSSTPSFLTNADGTVYFVAQDLLHGRELWKSDGTPDGTVMVKDIVVGAGSAFTSFISSFTPVNSTLFFVVDDGIHGIELWKSDGTEGGTVMVKDITAGAPSSEFFWLTAIGEHLYFTGNDGVHGQELWISDGTESGTHMVKDLDAGLSSSGVSPTVEFQGQVFFTASSASQLELWKTDGTEAGTVLISDVLPPRVGVSSGDLKVMNNNLYFIAGDHELWTSDGTTAGTSFVKQFDLDSPLQFLGVSGSTLFISAVDPVSGQELWKSDGTEGGTTIVKDINPDGSSSPGQMTIVGSLTLFVANDGINGEEIWITNGSEEGTAIVKNINTTYRYAPTELNRVGSDVFFINHRSQSTYEVWKSDGTTGGTLLVKDINPGAIEFLAGGVQASVDKLFMTLNDGEHGYELWVSDGSPEGTKILKDIRTGTESASVRLPENEAVLDGKLFFQANDGINGDGLWKTDGTEAGTVLVKPITTFGGPFIYSMLPVGDVLYFVTSYALWKSDGTEAGTVKVKEINPTYNGYNPGSLYNFDGTLYFVATDGVHGLELWKSDGTETGTYMIKDIHPEDSDHFPAIIGDINGNLILSAAATGFDYELWISDGTESGTMLLKEINSNEASSPAMISQDDQFIYFSAADVEHGNELWKTDGTAEGTTIVKDINPGVEGSMIFYSGMYKGNFYFSANDGTHGSELWKTDGTAEGTKLFMDINTGGKSSAPGWLTATNNTLFFTADDGVHGRELWGFQMLAQSITFDLLADRVATDSPFALEAVASSGLPVSFSLVSGNATISGNIVTLTGPGAVVVRASQDGDDHTDPAVAVERSFQVTKASQSISFAALPPKRTNDPPFDVTATSTSGLEVAFTIVAGPAIISESTITLTGAGEVTVQASQAGDEIYDVAEDVVQSFVVELVVGVEERRDATVKAYPNPASNVLHVNISKNRYSSIEILSSTGQNVGDPGKQFDNNRYIIDIKDLLPGMYILKVQQKDRVILERIIVN